MSHDITGKKSPSSERRKRNRAQELCELFGPERGTEMAFGCYMETYVYGRGRTRLQDAQRWLKEIKAACPPMDILRALYPDAAASVASDAIKPTGQLIVMSPEYRAAIMRKRRMAGLTA